MNTSLFNMPPEVKRDFLVQALQVSRELKVTIDSDSKSHDPTVHAQLHAICMQLGPDLPFLHYGRVLYLDCTPV